MLKQAENGLLLIIWAVARMGRRARVRRDDALTAAMVIIAGPATLGGTIALIHLYGSFTAPTALMLPVAVALTGNAVLCAASAAHPPIERALWLACIRAGMITA